MSLLSKYRGAAKNALKMLAAAGLAAAFSGCGGGGGGSTTQSSIPPPPPLKSVELKGTLLDNSSTPTPVPIANRIVYVDGTLSGTPGIPSQYAITAADGTFDITNLPVGPLVLRIAEPVAAPAATGTVGFTYNTKINEDFTGTTASPVTLNIYYSLSANGPPPPPL